MAKSVACGFILSLLMACVSPPAPQTESTALEPPGPLVNRVWIASNSASPPGRMLVFLNTGVLVMDSCFETYRLAKWRRDSDNRVIWNEDGKDITAEIVSLTDSDLRLRLLLPTKREDEVYTAAAVPYVCPDMPR